MICPICDSHYVAAFTWKSLLLSDQDRVCLTCKERLKKIRGPICPKCGREQSDDYVCQDCISWSERMGPDEVLVKNRSVYVYNEYMKEILARFKFRGDTALAELFKKDVRTAFKRSFPMKSRHIHIIPIPLSRERLKERKFNQSEVLAALLGVCTIQPLIKVHQSKQSKKNKNERLHQNGRFQLNQLHTIISRDVILIDDIYTTGATIYDAASILKNAGARSVSSFTLIRS
ncbi:ComF family protein [Bacillus sp. 179-C3.3 HS]|uniref:ComF family protein n=1 Tax=Bacillus sp. 179-C3.3 HS TaxID=3232162 RepID=UPI0039A2BB7F